MAQPTLPTSPTARRPSHGLASAVPAPRPLGSNAPVARAGQLKIITQTPPPSPPATPKTRRPSTTASSSAAAASQREHRRNSSVTSLSALGAGSANPAPPAALAQTRADSMPSIGLGHPSKSPSQGHVRKTLLPSLSDPHPHPLVNACPQPSCAQAAAHGSEQTQPTTPRPQPKIRTASAPYSHHSSNPSSSGSGSGSGSSLGPSPFSSHTSHATGARSVSTNSPASAYAPKKPCRLSRPPLLARDRSASEMSCSTYTSFDLRPPPTPADECDCEDEGTRHGAGWLSSWLGRKRETKDSVEEEDDEERRVGVSSKGGASQGMVERGERTPLLAGARRDEEAEVHERDNGLPKLSRECLVAEIKCYGFYMLPPLIVFVGLVLTIALWAYSHEVALLLHLAH